MSCTACASMQAKKSLNRIVARTQPCFTPIVMAKEFDWLLVQRTCPVIPSKSNRIRLHKLLWATISLQDRPEGLPVQIYKDRVKGLVLFNALLLHLSDDKYHVHGAAPLV